MYRYHDSFLLPSFLLCIPPSMLTLWQFHLAAVWYVNSIYHSIAIADTYYPLHLKRLNYLRQSLQSRKQQTTKIFV